MSLPACLARRPHKVRIINDICRQDRCQAPLCVPNIRFGVDARASLFKSRARLEAGILPKRPTLTNIDRLVFVWLYHWFPSTVGALAIVRPETVIRWHRLGFRAYWRWRSGIRVGRPKVSTELRVLIREMSQASPLWGAPRIHGELLKLGFEVAQ